MDYHEAPNSLFQVAEAAQDVAAGMNKFLAPVSSSAAEITEIISKCFAISSALQNAAKVIRHIRHVSWYKHYQEEISDVTYSLDYTLKDVHCIMGDVFKEAQDKGISQTVAFRQTWRDIDERFHSESGTALSERLEDYQGFLQTLKDALTEGFILPSRITLILF